MAGRCDTNDGHVGCAAAASVEGQCRQERAAARCRRDGWQRRDAHRGTHAAVVRPRLRERDAGAVASVVRRAQDAVGARRCRCPERRRAVVAGAVLDPTAVRGRRPSGIAQRGADRGGARRGPDRPAGTDTQRSEHRLSSAPSGRGWIQAHRRRGAGLPRWHRRARRGFVRPRRARLSAREPGIRARQPGGLSALAIFVRGRRRVRREGPDRRNVAGRRPVCWCARRCRRSHGVHPGRGHRSLPRHGRPQDQQPTTSSRLPRRRASRLLRHARGELHARILGVVADLRGELFKRFGIVVPGVSFRGAILDPARKLPPKAFRIELLTQTWADRDAIAIEVPDPDRAVYQFVDELRRRLLAWRTWWVTADYVDKQLERNEPLKAWLLERYALSDIKSLLRGVLRPSEAELGAYNAEGVDGALRRVAPGQSLRELDWLLGSLVFWSQAGLDGAQLVRALQDTQAARLAPDPQSSPAPPAMAVLAGIEALEQRDFPRAEQRFGEAVAADRRGAIASFPAAYASRDAVSVKGAIDKVTQACIDSERSGSYDEQARFELEDLLARHQDAFADPDRARLEYCLFRKNRSVARISADQMRASLKTFNTPRFSSLLDATQKYVLGYWTLELSGRSFDPPPDLAAAENWLASAFREWKETEQDEASAQSAFMELMNRYKVRSVPRWYLDLLQRLAELHPKNFYIAYDLGNWL